MKPSWLTAIPETVSTDFDIADKLYFEPVYWERVLDILEYEKPEGVILQVGGQTALKLAKRFHENQVSKSSELHFEMMDLAEDRGKFSTLLKNADIPFPEYGTAMTAEDAIGYCKQNHVPGAYSSKLCAWADRACGLL